ncbi:unnamed protein product [Soboliphyme baturini]|uniref:DNA-directed RNA polymerase n=1 Tax=Soboliphyme baturini TaxID=241478 RepID=A0A183J978_9BILA|nr:unnamed protein product [Soboliphyme baturini]
MFQDIPVAVMLRALGAATDREMTSLIGDDEGMMDLFAPSIDEARRMKIFTEKQALSYIGQRVRESKADSFYLKGSPVDDARNFLATYFLGHVPAFNWNMRLKRIYVALMTRRLIQVQLGVCEFDDPDFYGNKRLELAGSLLEILFEDLFKRLNSEV